jgi:voltage-gated sodium channel
LFFVSFIVLGTMVILNLVIGVVMNSMQEAQIENERMDEANRGGDEHHPSLEHELFELRQSMAATLERMERLTERAKAEER